MENPNYYGILPANVRYDKRICPNAKILYAEITALTQKEGHCWATNGYFAKLYDVAPSTVSSWIGELRDAGYITVEIDFNYQRRIFLTTPSGNSEGGYQKNQKGVSGKNDTPSEKGEWGIGKSLKDVSEKTEALPSEKAEENIININTTREYPAAAGKNFESEKNIKHNLENILLHEWGKKDGNVGYNILVKLVELGKECGFDRLLYAIEEAAKHNKRNYAYVEAILKPKNKSPNQDNEFQKALRLTEKR